MENESVVDEMAECTAVQGNGAPFPFTQADHDGRQIIGRQLSRLMRARAHIVHFDGAKVETLASPTLRSPDVPASSHLQSDAAEQRCVSALGRHALVEGKRAVLPQLPSG